MSIPLSQIDCQDSSQIMRAVLSLAAQGECSTQPNPQVGCILVKDGAIVGSGYHHKAGELHAERVALQAAGEKARGSVAYLNLEPCCHQGRTPPCTDALVDAGVVRIVCAMRDPNPLVAGGGFELLTSAGIEVESGILEEQAVWMNRGFVSRMRRKTPWLILKSAATLDGCTAAVNGESKWITSPQARDHVQALRARCSAILTGIDTVLADDPQMNVRHSSDADTNIEQVRQPLRVVLDSSLKIPLDAKIIGDATNIVVFSCSKNFEKIAELTEMGVEVIIQEPNQNNRLDLVKVMQELARWQCNEVLLEAGQTLSGAFMQAGLVDELRVFYAGSVLGSNAKGMFEFEHAIPFSERPVFSVQEVQKVGPDFSVSAINEGSRNALLPPQ